MSRIRAVGRLAAVAALLIVCLPPHLIAVALRWRSPWPRRFLRATARILGVRVRVGGAPIDRHVLIVANHRSWLDVLVVATASGCAFVSKAEIRRWPVVGWLAALHHTVFVARARRGEARDQADALRTALKVGRAVALFPEGTTNAGPGLLPFKPSLFASVSPPPPGVRVQPVLIDYGADAGHVGWPDAEGALANILRVIGRRGRIGVIARFLPPLDPAVYPDRKAIAAAAQAALEAAAVSR